MDIFLRNQKYLTGLISKFIIAMLMVFVSTGLCNAQTKEIDTESNEYQMINKGVTDDEVHQIEMLIKPNVLGKRFFKEWKFAKVEKFDEEDIVISVIDEKTRRVFFLWLTNKKEGIWSEGQSKSFNIICVPENRKYLDEDEQEAAKALIEMVKKNDKGEITLNDKSSGRGGIVADIRSEPDEGILPFSISEKLIWGILLVLLAVVFIYRIVVAIKNRGKIPE